jgi:hypothetical protein
MDKVVWCDRGWQPVEYCFCPSEKAWNKQLKVMGIVGEPYPDSDGRATFFTKHGKTIAMVTIRDRAEKVRTLCEIVGLLTHEGAHIWQEVRAVMGETNPSAEFEAYSMQSIVQELLFAMKNTRGLPNG